MMTLGEKMIWAAAFVGVNGPNVDVAAAIEVAAEWVVLARHAAKNPDFVQRATGMALAMLREMVGEEAATVPTAVAGPLPADVEKAIAQLEDMAEDWEANSPGDSETSSTLADASAARALIAHIRKVSPDPLAAVREHVDGFSVAVSGYFANKQTEFVVGARDFETWMLKLRALVGTGPRIGEPGDLGEPSAKMEEKFGDPQRRK